MGKRLMDRMARTTTAAAAAEEPGLFGRPRLRICGRGDDDGDRDAAAAVGGDIFPLKMENASTKSFTSIRVGLNLFYPMFYVQMKNPQMAQQL